MNAAWDQQQVTRQNCAFEVMNEVPRFPAVVQAGGLGPPSSPSSPVHQAIAPLRNEIKLSHAQCLSLPTSAAWTWWVGGGTRGGGAGVEAGECMGYCSNNRNTPATAACSTSRIYAHWLHAPHASIGGVQLEQRSVVDGTSIIVCTMMIHTTDTHEGGFCNTSLN